MSRRFRGPSSFAPLALVGALLLAACQGGGASPSDAGDGAATVEVGSSADLGELVVDRDGRTLYVFLQDEPGVTNCAGECAQAWPPLTVEGDAAPVAGEGIDAELGTIERDDGSRQVTLDGWPLYRYAADADPGQATGEGVGGVWFVARPDGMVPTGGETSEPDASASPSAGGEDPYDY